MRITIDTTTDTEQDARLAVTLISDRYGLSQPEPQLPLALPTMPAPPVVPLALPTMPAPPVVPLAPGLHLAPPAPPITAAEQDEQNTIEAGGVDAEGMPWDERIHASTKRRTQGGVWQRRKGVDDAVFAAVRGELRGAPVVAPVAPVVPTVPVVIPVVTVPIAPAVSAAPAAPVVAPVVTPPTAPDAPASDITWASLMQLMVEKQRTGKCTPRQMADIVGKRGVAPFPMLATRPDLWSAVQADFLAL